MAASLTTSRKASRRSSTSFPTPQAIPFGFEQAANPLLVRLRRLFDGDGHSEAKNPSPSWKRSARRQFPTFASRSKSSLGFRPDSRSRNAKPCSEITNRKFVRRMAGAGNPGAALPVPARRNAAPRLQGARPLGRRDGPREDHSSDRSLRPVIATGQGVPRSGGYSRVPQNRVGRTDSTLHQPFLSSRVWRPQEETWALRFPRLLHHR